MTTAHEPTADDDRTVSRAELLPEEVGVAQDPAALAEEVLAESDDRTDDPAAGLSGTGPTGVTGDDPLVSDTD